MIQKYRAWDKTRNEWSNGFFIYSEGGLYTPNYGFNRKHLKNRTDVYPIVKQERFILMQSTGIKDKKGKEIFDKDIIKNKDGRLAIVKWHGTYASFVYIWLDELDKNKQDWQPLYLAYMKFEVVGNVYQNPELIEEANNVDD